MNISVIIPTYNGRDLLEKNLPAVFESLRDHDELIIVDDSSSDTTVAWMQQQFSMKTDECLPNQHTGELPADMLCYTGEWKAKHIAVRMIVNAKNERFGVSCNRGVSEASHEIVVLLNNDVSPHPDFLKYLLPHFDQTRLFAVGCKELATAENNREYGRNEGKYERGFFVHRRSDDQNGTSTAWVVGGSGAFRKTQWQILHGFDPDFKPAYGEDIDLSFRAKNNGWEVAFEPRAVVDHNHESTNMSVFGRQAIEIASFKNACLFMWKTAPFQERMVHFLWLPYHLIFTSIRSRGNFLRGIGQALATVMRLV